MAIFGFGKDKEDAPGTELILAYLEEALRVRSPFTVEDGHGGETSALVHSVSEEARTFRLLPKEDRRWAKGGKAAFTLIHDGLRLGGTAQVVEAIPGVLTLQLPAALAVMERRRAPRARLSPKEKATVTALQDLFQGVGITGTLENVSEGGARVRVEKAIAIGTEKRLVLGSNLVPPGQKFLVIKLGKVPRCPPDLEAAGRAVYLAPSGDGLVIGFGFESLAGTGAAALRSLVAQRCATIPAQLPPKVRRRAAPREEETPTRPLKKEPEPSASPQERRHAPRLSLEPGFQARFMAGDQLIPEADLLDLSTGGCCLRMPLELCREIRKGGDLEEFHFLHPDLPAGVLDARVRWVLGRVPKALAAGTPGRYCLVGIEFTQVPEELARAVAAYVTRHLPEF